MKNEDERKASGVVIQHQATRSFFSLIWSTMFTASSKIVLRPMGQRKIEKRKLREERRAVNNKKNSASSSNR